MKTRITQSDVTRVFTLFKEEVKRCIKKREPLTWNGFFSLKYTERKMTYKDIQKQQIVTGTRRFANILLASKLHRGEYTKPRKIVKSDVK